MPSKSAILGLFSIEIDFQIVVNRAAFVRPAITIEITLPFEPVSSFSMPRSIRLINNPRLNHPYICLSCQSRLPTTASQPPQSQQKRWITRSHIIRIKEAMDDWAERADAIKNGKKQSMLSVLEERGFVNQIVGFVPRHKDS